MGDKIMQISNSQRARILVHALPYIQQYNGKIVVIKYGGNAMINEKLKDSVIRDIVLLSLIGVKVVLIHGGGPEITEMLNKIGKETEFVDGLRVTDKETAEVVQMVLAGKINKGLVNLLEQKGGRAMGLSGLDDRMILCEPKDPALGYVGKIEKVHIRPVTDLLEKGYIPVVSTVGCDRGPPIFQNAHIISACVHHGFNGQCHAGDQSGSTAGCTKVWHFRLLVQFRAYAVTYESAHN